MQRGRECGREADLQPCAALPIWTWSNRIPSGSGPRSSRRPSAFATRMRRPGAGGHLGEITGTGGAVFDNVHDARLSDSRIRGFERIDFRKNVLGRHEGGPQSLSFAKGSLPVICTYRRPRLPAICASAHRQGSLADFTRPIAAGPLRPKSLMGRTRKCEHQKIPHLKRHRAHARRTLAVQALNRFAVMQEAGRWATRTRKAHGRYRRSNA